MKVVATVLVLVLVVVALSGVLFIYDVPTWLPALLVAFSALAAAMLLYKCIHKLRKVRWSEDDSLASEDYYDIKSPERS